MTEMYNSGYPTALLSVGMYYVFLFDDRAKLWWIDNAIEAMHFDVFKVRTDPLEPDAAAAMPRFDLPGGDARHDQILADRFTQAHGTLVALQRDGFAIAEGHAHPRYRQLGAVMAWLNHLCEIGAESALDLLVCVDWCDMYARSQSWLADVSHDWLGQANYLAPITTEEGVGHRVPAGDGFYWTRLLTPAGFIHESNMLGRRLCPIAGFCAGFPSLDNPAAGVWSLRDSQGQSMLNVELVWAGLSQKSGCLSQYEVARVEAGTGFEHCHLYRLESLGAHLSAAGRALDITKLAQELGWL